MQSHPATARKRRWILVFVLFFAAVLYIFQAPADINLFVKYVFSARSYGHFLAIGLAFWLTFRSASIGHKSIFNLGDLSKAKANLWQTAFNGNSSLLKGSNLISEVPPKRVSGPRKAQLPMGVAAVIEPYIGQARVMGADEKKDIIASFEHIRELIDLRDQVATINLWGRSRDGIRIQVQSAKVVYSIHRSGQEASLSEPHPFSEKSALAIAYGQRIEASQHVSKSNHSGGNTISGIGSAHFERQLQRFIAEITLGELLATEEEGSSQEDRIPGSLLLARDILRRQFLSFCLEDAKERGLDVHWVDLGNWKVDELAQEIIDEILAENAIQSLGPKTNAYQDSRSQELLRLFSQLAQMDEDFSEDSESQSILTRLIGSFYGIFDGLKLRYGKLPGEDEKQIDSVLRFLNHLNKDLDQKQ